MKAFTWIWQSLEELITVIGNLFWKSKVEKNLTMRFPFGANSIVHEEIPLNWIVAENPDKVIKRWNFKTNTRQSTKNVSPAARGI